MAVEKRLENLSEEIKLLKGEIKNSLTSVRDYLLNMELPSSEFSTILAALSGENNGQKISLDGGLSPEQRAEEAIPDEAGEPTEGLVQPPPEEDLIDLEQPEDLLVGEEELNDMLQPEEEAEEPLEEELVEEEISDEEESPEEEEEEEEETEEAVDENMENLEADNEDSGLESETPVEEEQPMELERTTVDTSQGTPKVNMLANLINWVAKAKKEIGEELLPTFLDVYGVSGHLSLELKEVILHLAERTKEKTEPCTDADIWSQAMLSLHGILTGGDAPLNPPIPSWESALEDQETEEEIIEVDKAQDKPVKLKLVFPSSNGKDKEYCLDLTPENDGKGDD